MRWSDSMTSLLPKVPAVFRAMGIVLHYPRSIKGMNQSRFTVFGIDIHLGTIVERHNCNYIAAVLAGGGNTKLASPISGRHRLRNDVVTVSNRVGDIRVRTSLKYGYLLIVACFDRRTAQICSIAVIFACPYIPYLTFLERYIMCSDIFITSICRQVVIYGCFSIFYGYNCKVATLRLVLVIRRRIRLYKIVVVCIR